MSPLSRALRGGLNDWRLHASSIFSVAVAFVCMAATLLVVVNVENLRDAWARAGRASVYLVAGATREQAREIEQALRASAGVTDVRFVSSDEARRELVDRDPDGLIGSLPAESFPASLEVRLLDTQAAERVEAIATQLAALPAVEGVETYRAWTQRLGEVLSGGVLAALLLAAVVLAAVVSVVASTIRLTLQRRRIEVEVLKLVGADDDYVRRPFIIEGAAQGLLGSMLAIGLLGALYAIVIHRLPGDLVILAGVTPSFLPWHLCLTMMGAGALLGAVAAWGSLRKLVPV